MEVANALAYYDTVTSTAVSTFLVQPQGLPAKINFDNLRHFETLSFPASQPHPLRYNKIEKSYKFYEILFSSKRH
jgi:hypothetical protein